MNTKPIDHILRQKRYNEIAIVPLYIEPVCRRDKDSIFLTNADIKALLECNNEDLKISVRSLGLALRELGFKRTSSRRDTNKNPIGGYWVKLKK